jgi:hypothetical protein
MKRIVLFVFLIFLIFSSCSTGTNSTIILWTDKPEVAAYVEEFNAVQEKYRIEIIYKKNPGLILGKSNTPVDLVISEFLNSPEIIDLFSPINDVYEEDKMNLSIFYSGLLDLGYKDEELFLLPVSFNLPTVMFKKITSTEDIPTFYMNPSDLKETSISFNNSSDSEFEVMGFSQRWDSEVLFLNSVLMGTSFKTLSSGILSWNDQKLSEALELSKTWSQEVNGGLENEKEFTTKFLYDPSYKLIEKDRILYYYSDIVNFFSIAPEKRKELDFRWFAAEDRIPVLGNILYSGIPITAKNRDGAVSFFYWFFNPETQTKLLKSTQIKRMDTFGFANGFSSLREINENEIPIIYPNLVGSIPKGSSLIFPNTLPLYWTELKTKVIKPWMYDQTGDNPQETSLQIAIDEWLKQKS